MTAHNCRVTVRVQGAPRPVYTTSPMSRTSAEQLAYHYRAQLKEEGSTHVVEIVNGS